MRFVVLFSCVVVCSGCVSAPKFHNDDPGITNYVRNRAMDARDIGTGTLIGSSSFLLLGSSLRVGPTALGLFSDYDYDGLFNRKRRGPYELGLKHGEIQVNHSNEITVLINMTESSAAAEAIEKDSPYSLDAQRSIARRKQYENRWLSREPSQFGRIEIAAGLFFFGFRIGVNFIEAVDFLTGLFGFDPIGDDVYVNRERLEPCEGSRTSCPGAGNE
jgi:hypothetical protein